MQRHRILIVEDLPSLAITYAAQLEHAGHQPVMVHSAAAALTAIASNPDFSAILLDLQLPDAHGLEWLRANPQIIANYPVVVATADASLARAIEAMRLGAFDFLVKPIAGARLLSVLGSAIELGRPALSSPAGPTPSAPVPPPTGRTIQRPGTFIGSSPAMQEIYRLINCVASSRATVFITGESGTGKDVCAEAIHRASGRAGGPFIAINCGAIPENLLESELFGHLKGSFTGALADRVGAVQAAHKGTLFLDEICELALPLQVKLLRFLQTGTVQRVGANTVEEVDVRIICATNRDPEREVAEGRLRGDLFYRLAVVPLHMPPLRERPGDVRELAQAFLDRFADEEGKRFDPLSAAQLARLESHSWPGNVRELQNIMRRAAVLNPGPSLPASAFPVGAVAVERPVVAPLPPHDDLAMALRALRGLTLDTIERLVIEATIDQENGSLPAAARALGLSPSTLYRKRERWQQPDSSGSKPIDAPPAERP